MDGTDETLQRLAAFAEGVAWPDELGVSLHEFGPCFLGTTIHLDVFAEYEGDDEVLAEYPRLTPEQVALGRDYWERHGPLFEAACWLSYTENAAFPSPEGDQLATLQADIRHLLTLVKTPAESERLAALAAWEEAQAIAVQAVAHWQADRENHDVRQAMIHTGRAERRARAALLDAQRKGGTDDNG